MTDSARQPASGRDRSTVEVGSRAHGGDMPVVEPATGGELGRTGAADAEDVAQAAATAAAAAQKAWAATNFEERAAVLRRAGDLILANAAEIQRLGQPGDRRHRRPGRVRGRRRGAGVLRGGRAGLAPARRDPAHQPSRG